MNYIRVATAHNGYLVRDDSDSIKKPFVFDFEGNTNIDHVFRDGSYYFVSEELKDSIESGGLKGVAFEKISTTHDKCKTAKRSFYEMVFIDGTNSPDFYLYDKKKLAASPKAVSLLQKMGGDAEYIALNELSDSEKFLADFEEEQKLKKQNCEV